MPFNNVPANGWPQIKDLEKLDALAKQIEDMPTFTSDDREWLNEWEAKLPELPADPEADGVKILKATTTSGETTKSWGDPELPADPETDGVKVLTATTTSGETVKSWEDPESGNINYSTTEQNTGIKWIDGKDIFQRVATFENGLSLTGVDWTASGIDASGMDRVIDAFGITTKGSMPLGSSISLDVINVFNFRSDTYSINALVYRYTKATT